MSEDLLPHWRSPEDVAPELGMTPTELRRYCRISKDHCTRLSRNKIMLDKSNIKAIIAYIKQENSKPVVNEETGLIDPFA